MCNKVVFLCKGTRGDVQPLLSIALGYKQRHPLDEVVFACAPSVAAELSTLMPLPLDQQLSLFHLPDLGTLLHQDLETARRLAASDVERLSFLQMEAKACLEAAKGASLVVFNLFTLEGFFIAQHLGVPCIAASPFVLTRTPPTGFESKFAEAQHELYQKLKSAKSGLTASAGEVSYREVDHWMWRLFLDDFGHVCESLGISPLPFTTSTQSLPPPTPLLYGVSTLVIHRQQYWPDSVKMTGYWVLPEVFQEPSPPELVSLVSSLSMSQLIYIGFGSMEAYLIHVDWEGVFRMFENALETFNLTGLFQCTSDGRIAKAYAALTEKPQRLHLWAGSVPHSWLFDKCCVILHHGGSGTVAMALLAKKPQIICPVMFDQQFWAEQLSWEGLAIQCSNLAHLTTAELTSAIKVLFGSKMVKNVEGMAAELSKEDGVKVAVDRMEKMLSSSKSFRFFCQILCFNGFALQFCTCFLCLSGANVLPHLLHGKRSLLNSA